MTTQELPTRALQDRVYGELKERIINCDMPPGTVISEEHLSAEFGTSRTPIREALLRLQRENLVVIFPRQGTFVSQIALKDIYEIYQVRQIVEPRVARMQCAKIDPLFLRRYHEIFSAYAREGDDAEWSKHDRDFHSYIIGCTENRFLMQMYGTIMDQLQRIRVLSGRLPRRLRETNEEHLDLVEALESRDEERIERVMTAHIIASRDAAIRMDTYIHD